MSSINIPPDFAKYFDHTLLKPEATEHQIAAFCKVAVDCGVFSVCVNSWWVKFAAEHLSSSPVAPIAVVGFPLGLSTAKKNETFRACRDGAREIDMVMAIGPFKSGRYKAVTNDIAGVVSEAYSHPVKVIIETALLSEKEIKDAAVLCVEAGASYVKTSTGFSTRGASVRDIELIREAIGPYPGVKASGGISTLAAALAMIAAGATRIGSSASERILTEAAALR